MKKVWPKLEQKVRRKPTARKLAFSRKNFT